MDELVEKVKKIIEEAEAEIEVKVVKPPEDAPEPPAQ
jgi:hypothetical protein